jgi:hypothetical protein
VSETAIKEMLKRIAKSSGHRWESVGRTIFGGKATLATANAEYAFVDGVCSVVAREGQRKTSGGFVGMRLVGWLAWSGAEVEVLPTFQRGASAVLWKPGLAGGSVALTSPTLGWWCESAEPEAPVVEAPPEPPRSSVHVKAAAPSSSSVHRRSPRLGVTRPAVESVTRIHTALALPVQAAPRLTFPKTVPRPGR